MYEHNGWKMWFETDPPREAGTAPGSPPPKRTRRPAPQQDIGRRVYDLSPEGRWFYYEGPKGHEKVHKMVDMVDMPGYEEQQLRTTFYKGERRHERKVREEYANGTVTTFEGEQGKEALRTATELTGGYDDDESEEKKTTFYEGERENERKTRVEYTNGTVMTFEGERGKEALREVVSDTIPPLVGKMTSNYEGRKGKEALRRVSYNTAREHIIEIWDGKRRREYKVETRYEDGTVERHPRPSP